MENHKDIYGLIPGLMQGLTRVTISYPVDVIKVQMQKQLYNNSIDAIKNTLKYDIGKFYRGSSISYFTIGLERSLQYYYLEKINKKYNSYLAGFMVSIISSIYNVPMQFATTNIALFNKNNANICNFLKQTNLKKFYTGYFAETPKNILGSTIYLGTYMKLRSYTTNNNLYPFFGGLSGIIVWLVIYPLDTIKTEIQTTKNTKYSEFIIQRYRNYGIKSFYKGLTPVLVRTFPSAFMGMYVYEKMRMIINKM